MDIIFICLECHEKYKKISYLELKGLRNAGKDIRYKFYSLTAALEHQKENENHELIAEVEEE